MNNLFSGFNGRTVFRVLLTDTLMVINIKQITKPRISDIIKKAYQSGGSIAAWLNHPVKPF